VKGVTALSGGAVLALDDVIHANSTHLSGHFIKVDRLILIRD
jgi:hypothetical protein